MKKQDVINKLNDMGADYRIEDNDIRVTYCTSDYFGEYNLGGADFADWMYYDVECPTDANASYGYEIFLCDGFNVICYDEAADE